MDVLAFFHHHQRDSDKVSQRDRYVPDRIETIDDVVANIRYILVKLNNLVPSERPRDKR